MKFPWTWVAVASLLHIAASTSNAANAEEFSIDKVKSRIDHIDIPFEPQYTAFTGQRIKQYVTTGRKQAEAMLGRTSLYFPIFEHYLNAYNLPQELKCLPMVESTLRPNVKSNMNAAGLWQFVPITGRHFGLEINHLVDERQDPYRSTEAAVKMLSSLYEEFQDWPLALAAYNCGTSRVKRTIKKANCDNYWDIRHLLPRESRRYVSAFIAAAYLLQHHESHGLTPNYPAWELQKTSTFVVYDSYSLNTIAKKTLVNIKTLRKLNPGYLTSTIPANKKGRILVLPSFAAKKFQSILDESRPSVLDIEEGYYAITYTTVEGDNLNRVASLFECSPSDIMQWNYLETEYITINQPLKIYVSDNKAPARP